jgi:cell wall-associated NlpC family hydrolase
VGFFLAAGLLALLFAVTEAAALPAKASTKTAPAKAVASSKAETAASCAVAKPPAAASKKTAKVSAPVKAKQPVKPKAAAVSRKGRKASAKPLINVKTVAKAEGITEEIGSSLPSDLEREIGKFLGMRYRFGGTGQGGFDCSALIREVYSNLYGIDLPRSSAEQSRVAEMQSVEEEDLRTGDLLFFGSGGKRPRVNHVGMYLSGGYFFHAARSEGVTISRIDQSYWKRRFIFSKRVPGLEIGEEDEVEDADLDQALRQFAATFTLGARESDEMAGMLDAGIKVNDSLELALSGFFLNAIDEEDRLAYEGPWTALEPSAPPEPEAGFRLAAILSPLEWFKLIPNVTQIERSGKDDARDEAAQKLGLETWFMFPTANLALFMAARADSEEDIFEEPLAVAPDWQTLDVALGLHYSLSDSLRFSIWGTRSYSPDQRLGEDADRRTNVSDDITFKMDVRF